jgi:hypothetical protein
MVLIDMQNVCWWGNNTLPDISLPSLQNHMMFFYNEINWPPSPFQEIVQMLDRLIDNREIV